VELLFHSVAVGAYLVLHILEVFLTKKNRLISSDRIRLLLCLLGLKTYDLRLLQVRVVPDHATLFPAFHAGLLAR